MYFQESIEAGGLISGRKQVMVQSVRDDSTYLKNPKGFFDLILVVSSWVTLNFNVPSLVTTSDRLSDEACSKQVKAYMVKLL